jgi:hypothetical protein
MWAIRDISERDGVSRQAVSKKVNELVRAHGLMIDRDQAGRIIAVNVVEYDRLRGRFGDPSKAQAPKQNRSAPNVSQSESLDEARRLGAWQDVERKRIEMAITAGALVKRDAMAAAIAECAQRIAAIVDRLPNAADVLATAVAKEGQHGLRTALRKLTVKMRTDIAAALQIVASGAPDTDQFNVDTEVDDTADA